MKEDIVLVGSGQHARVVLYNLSEQGKYNAVALLDADTSKKGAKFEGIEILGDYTKENLAYVKEKFKTNKFFISFGNMKYRYKVYNLMVENSWEPVNVIHPHAVISPNAKIGKGVLIECGCLITPNPVIGDNVVVNTGSQVNHDNIIEDHVYIASGVVISGGVKIGKNTLVDDGSIISLGKAVGENCIIGAGSVVTKNISENMIAYGNPCREIRKNEVDWSE